MTFEIRPVAPEDGDWVRALFASRWGGPIIVTGGRIHRADLLPGVQARKRNKPAGLATYSLEAGVAELVSLDSLSEGEGIGSALVEAVVREARAAGCRRLFLVTTNDNLRAIRFYRRRGFVLRAVRPFALERSRRLKPTIPLVGLHGIPLLHEVEFDLDLVMGSEQAPPP